MTRQEAIRILEQYCPKRPQKLWSIELKEAVTLAIEVLSAQPDLWEEGTLMMTVPQGMLGHVKRIMVDEFGTKNCKVFYQDDPDPYRGES